MVRKVQNDTVVRGGEEEDEVVEEALSPFSLGERRGQIQREITYLYLRYLIFYLFIECTSGTVNACDAKTTVS